MTFPAAKDFQCEPDTDRWVASSLTGEHDLAAPANAGGPDAEALKLLKLADESADELHDLALAHLIETGHVADDLVAEADMIELEFRSPDGRPQVMVIMSFESDDDGLWCVACESAATGAGTNTDWQVVGVEREDW
jgi:hypothetical protein